MKTNTIFLFGIPISGTSKNQVLAVVSQWLRYPTVPKIIATPNSEIIVEAQKNQRLARALQNTDLNIADSWGVTIAARLQSSQPKVVPSLAEKSKVQSPKVQRISGIELMEALVEKATREGWRVMFIGGKEHVAQTVSEILFERTVLRLGGPSSQDFRMIGEQGPEDIFDCSQEDMNKLVFTINRFKPDLLFVAFGPGRQEIWMEQWRARLQVGVMMGVGGAFDQIANSSLRPWKIADRVGLGWLYRLVREPWRWRRQLALLRFLKMVTMAKFTEMV